AERDVSDPDLSGRVVIVTGATRGIGRGLARVLARAGAQLVVTGRKPDRLAETSAGLAPPGADPPAGRPAGAGRDAAFELARRAAERFGRIDGLVANAQSLRSVRPLEEVTPHDVDVLFESGPKGTLWSMQAVFPFMRAQGYGRIVTLGSAIAISG